MLNRKLWLAITGTDLQLFVTSRKDQHGHGWELLAALCEHISPSSPKHLVPLFGNWTSLRMSSKESVRAYASCARLLLVLLERAGQTFTNVVQALCFIQGLDMQRFHPFYMTFITGSRSVHSSSLDSVDQEASSFFSAYRGQHLLTASAQCRPEIPLKSLPSLYAWYGMEGKAMYLAKILYGMYKCPVCCTNAHTLLKCPVNPHKGGGGGGSGSGSGGGGSSGGGGGGGTDGGGKGAECEGGGAGKHRSQDRPRRGNNCQPGLPQAQLSSAPNDTLKDSKSGGDAKQEESKAPCRTVSAQDEAAMPAPAPPCSSGATGPSTATWPANVQQPTPASGVPSSSSNFASITPLPLSCRSMMSQWWWLMAS